jgi:hypothetical protein
MDLTKSSTEYPSGQSYQYPPSLIHLLWPLIKIVQLVFALYAFDF